MVEQCFTALGHSVYYFMHASTKYLLHSSTPLPSQGFWTVSALGTLVMWGSDQQNMILYLSHLNQTDIYVSCKTTVEPVNVDTYK